ncbi:ArdC-like ssDNA-binding domain-containing protein [Haladaptatus sp. ZSTT2]|uniref:ArdC-like ssDNA-binding domain-containing protein n=1 Tax=Haladaptatus sp. ZSTT2 TaxID=3120515 RepID=UPI00300E9E57
MNSTESVVSFSEADTRADEMHRTIETWLSDLQELTDEARASDEFKAWLNIQSRFHEYSVNNTLLIKHQCPNATKVAGYRTWQSEFDRQVCKGESAIWIWAPSIARRCPECGNAPSYHKKIGCEYDEKPVEEWKRDIVGFRPVPVFDISQTEGDPLPHLDTEVTGDGATLLSSLLDAADTLEIDANLVSPDEWSHGRAQGVCLPRGEQREQPHVYIKQQSNEAAVSHTLVHEFAHALIHTDEFDSREEAKREVEAESVAYIVSRYCGLDADNAAFYLASWQREEAAELMVRLNRIRDTVVRLIDALERPMTD